MYPTCLRAQSKSSLCTLKGSGIILKTTEDRVKKGEKKKLFPLNLKGNVSCLHRDSGRTIQPLPSQKLA